jgi:nicotinate-nucleotide adenylyltransferase
MEQQLTIERLDELISSHPLDTELYIRRGKLHYQSDEFGLAMNDFLKVKEIDPSSVEAEQYLDMINEILEFRYKDIYNP